MSKRYKVIGLVSFSGSLDPDVEGAMAELRQHGFEVIRMPEKFRPLLDFPRDDFVEVSMAASLSTGDYRKLTADDDKIVDEIWAEARTIATCYDASADNFGLAHPGELPFTQLFGEELVNDDAKLAAEIKKRRRERQTGSR